MKTIILIFFLACGSFVYSKETNCVGEFTQSNITDTCYKQEKIKVYNIEPKVNDNKIPVSCERHIAILSILITIVIGVLAFFNGLNAIVNHQSITNAQKLVDELAAKKDNIFKELTTKKTSIVDEIEKTAERLFNDRYAIQIAIAEINMLLSQENPNKVEIYAKLSTIIEKIDISTIYVVKKCKGIFPNDEDIERLAKIAYDNVAKEPKA